MPQQTLEKGDPYYRHRMKTARLLREKLTTRPEFAGVRFETTSPVALRPGGVA